MKYAMDNGLQLLRKPFRSQELYSAVKRRSPAVSSDSDHKVTGDAEKRPEKASMSGWYVSYRAGAGTVMSLAKSGDEAVSTACALWGQKIDDQEIGPLLGMRDPGDVIDSVEIRKLHAMRIQTEWIARRRASSRRRVRHRLSDRQGAVSLLSSCHPRTFQGD
jgi:hypothetical protein